MMPLPEPESDENEDEFIERCMEDDVMTEEFRNEEQRLAVCQVQWKESKK